MASRRCESACSNERGAARRRQQFDLTPEPSGSGVPGALGKMTLDEAVKAMEERVGSTISALEERKESAHERDNLRFGKAFSQFLGADNLDEVLLGQGLPPKKPSAQQQHGRQHSRTGSAIRSKQSPDVTAIPTSTAAECSSSGARPRSARPRSAVRPAESDRPKVRADSAKVRPRSGRDASGTLDGSRAKSRPQRPQSARPPTKKKEPMVTSDESKQIDDKIHKLVAERMIILQEESRGIGLKHDPEREARRKAQEARIEADMKELEDLKQEMLREQAVGEAAAPAAEGGASTSGTKQSSSRRPTNPTVPTARIMDKISKKWELDQDRRGRHDAVEAWNVELESSTLRAVRKATGDPETGTYNDLERDEESSSRPRHTWWGGIAEYSEEPPPSSKLKKATSSSRHQTEQPTETALKPPTKFNRAYLVKAPQDRQTAAAGPPPEGSSSSRLRSRGASAAEVQPDSCWRE